MHPSPKVPGPFVLASQVTTAAARIGSPENICTAGLYISYLPITVMYFSLSLLLNETLKISVTLSSSSLYNNTLGLLEEDGLSLIHRSKDRKVKSKTGRKTTQRS